MNYGENLDLANIEYFCEFDLVWKIEEWRDIPNYEGHYQISDLGRVKSLKLCRGNTQIILKQSFDDGGYNIISLLLNSNSKTGKVHQLVAIAFLGHKPCKMELVINHKNFIKTDNRKLNLEITTSRKNTDKKHIKSTSVYTGVSWDSRDEKWKAQIIFNKKVKHLGSFDNEKEASEYYENALISINNNLEIKVKLPKYSSKYKGVVFDKRGNKWLAQININRKCKYIGSYQSEIEAHYAFEKFMNEIK